MDSIKFGCPKCGQSLQAPRDMWGSTIKCPSCMQSLTIPNPKFKNCPLCAEEIRFDAIKCKHCGEMLNRPKTNSIKQPSQSPARVSLQISNPHKPSSAAQPGKHYWWKRPLALPIVTALIATPFWPRLPFWIGITLLLLCVGALIKMDPETARRSANDDIRTTSGKIPPKLLAILYVLQRFCRRLFQFNSDQKWLNGLRLASYGVIGLVLIFVGSTRVEKQRLVSEANGKVQTLFDDAIKAAKSGDIDIATNKILAASAIPHATVFPETSKLSQQIRNATDADCIRSSLMNLSDQDFEKLKISGTIPAQFVSGYIGLDHYAAKLVKADVLEATKARENRRLAQLEAERKHQEEAKLAEEAERQQRAGDFLRKMAAEAEIKRKAEEEYNADGLILLRKTVQGTSGEFGGVITGMVINRRSHQLSYAQIQFNLYDGSGAQVGTALANINGLEAGGKWKFQASTFGTDYVRYKFSELSGF
jgi:hypothetical protein